MRRQDLLDDQVEGSRGPSSQSLEVSLGIEESVDVVDPKAVDRAALEHAENAVMDVVEDGLELNAQARKVVDVEEAAVVDLVLGDAMERRAPELLADEPVEFAPVLVQISDAGVDRRADAPISAGEIGKFALQRPRSLRDLRAPLRQIEKEVGHPVKRRVLMAKDKRKRQRMDRQLVGIVGPDGEAAVDLETKLKFSRLQLLAILRAKHRRKEFAVLGRPVDVEPGCISGIGAPFQNVEPERIVGAPHADVIGHDVENSTELMAAERVNHRHEILFDAEFRIELVVIGDVVAVHTAWPRLENRREIDVADAELRKVGRNFCGVVEAEAGVELQAIGRARGGHSGVTAQRTVHAPKEAPRSPQDQNGWASLAGKATGLDERLASRISRR